MEDPPSIPFEAAEKALALAAERGAARETVLAAAGVEARPIIPLEALCRIYEEAARLTGDGAFGLHVGERTSAKMYGLLGYVAANSATFGDALVSLTEFQRLWSDSAGLELRRGRGAATVTYWHRGGLPAELRRHEHEQMLSALLSFARETLRQAATPIAVRFEHARPADISEHERIFEAPLQFAAHSTELVLPLALLRLPLAGADLTLCSLIRSQAETAIRQAPLPLIERLRADIRRRILDAQGLSLPASAAALGVGARSLQRRLREQRLTFRQLAEEARIDLAGKMLADAGTAIGEISFRLGYSQPSAFHRAFKQRTGTTPRRFRLRALGQP